MSVRGALERYRVAEGKSLSLDKIDQNERVLYEGEGKHDHFTELDRLRDELQALQKMQYAENKRRVLVVIQAMDTGGKDGCVKDVFSRVDPQGLNVAAFKKPSEEQLRHDFLWRIHQQMPGNGHITVFNRSHYEDIVAVRVKKIFPEKVWRRRYQHVLDFERMLVEEGTVIVKFFLHISKDEQKRRLEARLLNPAKHWKFNPDDLADRSRWGKFMEAYEDVIQATSREYAPWYVIPSDRKWYRSLCVARIMVDTLKKLHMKYPEPSWDPKTISIDGEPPVAARGKKKNERKKDRAAEEESEPVVAAEGDE
ncbi:MAG: polyphosphate kinase 2 family protein [Verrucomicrobia bacterium]|nr:polyphosphate kinase 2 family protein [Verrucomicrobiota bacterium]